MSLNLPWLERDIFCRGRFDFYRSLFIQRRLNLPSLSAAINQRTPLSSGFCPAWLTLTLTSSQVLKAATYNRKDASNRYITSYVNFGGDRSLGGFDCGA